MPTSSARTLLKEAHVLLLALLLAVSGFLSAEMGAVSSARQLASSSELAGDLASGLCLHAVGDEASKAGQSAPGTPADQHCPCQDHCALCSVAHAPLGVLPARLAALVRTTLDRADDPATEPAHIPHAGPHLPPKQGPPSPFMI